MTEAAQAASARPRPWRSVALLAGVGALLALAAGGLKSWRDYEQVRGRELRLEGEIAGAERRIRTLERTLDRLADDPATLDRLAREQLGLVRPDEVVIVLPEPPASGPAAAQAVRRTN